jgi:2-(1,2-epoxy-1,2-dihydrophenyl)acetyl-CoA isomerase
MTTEETNSVIGVALNGDGVAIVTRNAPPNNFISVESLRVLAESLETLDANDDCRVIVLRSEGKNFCGGADLTTRKEPAEKSVKQLGPAPLYEQALRLFKLTKPLVAVTQGSSIGGGLGLALACDFRVASPESRFSANFSRLGFHQGFGTTETLPAVVGQQRAWELLYTGKRVDGDTAFRIGLCDRLVAVENLDDEGVRFATEIAEAAPLAVQSIRATMRLGLAERVAAAVKREATEQTRLAGTHDFREGVHATNERRAPRFSGR